MKRLLAYLLLVLGLGLIFIANAKANKTSSCSNININLSQQYLKCLQKETRTLERFVYSTVGKSISKKDFSLAAKSFVNIEKDLNSLNKLKNSSLRKKDKELIKLLIKDLKTLERGLYSLSVSKKKEPVEIWKIESAFNQEEFIFNLNEFETLVQEFTNKIEEIDYKKRVNNNYSRKLCENDKSLLITDVKNINNQGKVLFESLPSILPDNFGKHLDKFNSINRIYNELNKKTLCDDIQIAKAEPSQTPKVSNEELIIYKAKYYGNKTGKSSNRLFLGVSDKSLDDAMKNAMKNCLKKIYGNSRCKIHSTNFENTSLKFENKQIAKHSNLIKPDTWLYFVRLSDNEYISSSKFHSSIILNNKKNLNNYEFDPNENLFKYIIDVGGRKKTNIRISQKLYNTIFNNDSSVLAIDYSKDTKGDGMGEFGFSKEKTEYIKSLFKRIENYKPYILSDLINEYTDEKKLKSDLLAYHDIEKLITAPKKIIEVVKSQEISIPKSKYNWYAVAKYPTGKKKFIATKVSNEKNARRIALKKCFDFIKKENINFQCYIKFVSNENENPIIAKQLIKEQSETLVAKNNTQIAKVEEPKQEEFKPKTKDIDNDAPIIEIAEAITVDSQAYTLKGKVKDKSKLYIEANGRPLKLNKETFQIEGFIVDPEAGEQIKLVAIDQWKNKSEKTINIKVKFQEVADKRIYEIPNPSKIKVKLDRNKIAIIIGIEKYRSLKNIDAPFANRDANAFRAYANKALGIPNKNIKVLIDDNATRAETLKALTLWLPQTARGKGKDIYIFFAGHGLASDDGKNLYILPQDGDAALLQYTAISRLEIFELINKVEPSSVTMFFDTCYSGQTRDERMLVAGLRPIRLLESEQEKPTNFTIFTASNYDETSGSIEEAKHGIFSYFLMKGMEGKADENNDKKITNGELITYLKQNVSEEAFMNNRQQEPMLSGDPNKILIKFN
tara:strand:- start:2513 stop:5377 length:2865 start_codon:yes stop_codon:yes gene_type:complete